MTTVYFLLDAEEETPITDIQYGGYPHFEKGDIVSLQVNNHNPDTWNADNLPYTEYEVVKKQHHAEKYYGRSVNFDVRLYVYLKKITSL